VSDSNAGMIRRLALTSYYRRETPFTLSSGSQSNEYVDAKQFLMNAWNMKPYALWICECMDRHKITRVGGPSLGGAMIVGAVVGLYGLWMKPCHGCVVREKPKSHGTGRLIEGFIPEPDSEVVVVEDVINTGTAVLETIECIEANGARVVSVCCLVDREEGGVQMLEERGREVNVYTSLSVLRNVRDVLGI
jgi:orotate phosphoribosyltransferase